MRVAAVQYRPTRGRVSACLDALVQLGRAAGPCDLLVMPEMAATGYVFPDADAVRAVAEPADGPTLRALAPLARELGCWLVAGFPEVDGARLFNSALVIDRGGSLAFVYRKTLLYEADLRWASPGDSGYRCFDTGAGRFGVGICMDLNDDAFVAWLRAEQPDAVAFPTNWVQEEGPVWDYWAWRMDGVRGALVAANRWGEEDGVGFRGESAVLRQLVVHAWGPAEGDGVLRATLLRQ